MSVHEIKIEYRGRNEFGNAIKAILCIDGEKINAYDFYDDGV